MKSKLPRCKFCKGRVIWAKDAEGFMIPVDLGVPGSELLLTPHDGGWKATHPNDIAKLKAAGHITGRLHRCPTKEK